jgi:hypothetical protein
LQSNRAEVLDDAADARTEAVNMYWIGIFVLIFIGMTVLGFYGTRRSKPILVLAILGILVIATVVGGVVLNVENLALTEDKDRKIIDPQDTPGNATDVKNAVDVGGGGDDWWEQEEDTDNDMMPRDWLAFNGDGIPEAPAMKDTDADGYTDTTDVDDDTVKREKGEVHVREYFPETWYWNPVLPPGRSRRWQAQRTRKLV